MANDVSEATPPSGSLEELGNAFAGLLSDGPGDSTPRERQPEQATADTPEPKLAPAAPEEQSTESEPATDEGAEASATAEPEASPTYKTVVDGKEVEVTLEEALKGYSRTADYLKKTEALANQRKEFEEKELSAVRAERQQMAASLGQLQEFLQASSPPEPNLATSASPEAFAVEWTQWKQHQDHIARVAAAQAQVKAKADADALAGFMQYRKDERAKLVELLPELKDPAKDAEISNGVYQYALSQGYTHEQFEATSDHRMLLMAYKAMQYDRDKAAAKAKAPDIKSKITNALATTAPGTSATPPKPDAIAAAQKKLQQSGRVEDAGAVFAQLL